MIVYQMRIVYKGGATVDFEVTEFTVSGGHYEWKSYGERRPILLGVDDIAAVWQLGSREVAE